MKPIIMSTEDVRALLDGRKTMMRQVIKPQPVLIGMTGWPTPILHIPKKGPLFPGTSDPTSIDVRWRFAPYKPGDVLYVRETWQEVYETEYDIYNPNEPLKITDLIVGFDNLPKKCAGLSREWSCSSMPARNKYYVYAASKPEYTDEKHELKWRPSTQMPREAARLFLRVKDVRVERVQDITAEDALKEGCTGIPCDQCAGGYFRGCTDCMNSGWQEPPQLEFSQRWDARNAKHGYGWDSNLWTWVIEFERVERGAEL